MRHRLLLPLIVASASFAAHAQSFNLNDCIINGMKGVGSNMAAANVRWACNQKDAEYKKQRTQELIKEYGEPIDTQTLERAKFWNEEDTGVHSQEFTNKSPDKLITYIRLAVSPAPNIPNAECDLTKQKVYAYRVTLKKNNRVQLIYPSSAQSECVIPTLVMARPPSWKDISLSSSTKPTTLDPFAGID